MPIRNAATTSGYAHWKAQDIERFRTMLAEDWTDGDQFIEKYNAEALNRRTPSGVYYRAQREKRKGATVSTDTLEALHRIRLKAARAEGSFVYHGKRYLPADYCEKKYGFDSKKLSHLARRRKLRRRKNEATGLYCYLETDLKRLRDGTTRRPSRRPSRRAASNGHAPADAAGPPASIAQALKALVRAGVMTSDEAFDKLAAHHGATEEPS